MLKFDEKNQKSSNVRPLRVLVVDDSRLQRRILTASLVRWGYEILEAESGEQALEICATDIPDIVLSDWMMSGMDGLEFCRAFRNIENDRYGYFILLTSKSEKTEVARGLEAGADDFLTKPVNANELRARISAGERVLHMERELKEKNRLVNATLDELKILYESLDNDLLAAKKLQQSLIREKQRDFGAAQVSLLLRSAGHVGGDLVGFYPIGSTRVGLFGIDVSGHGISSALMTARLAGYLSSPSPEQNIALKRTASGAHQPLPPAQVIQEFNRLVMEEMETEHYFTLLLAEVDVETGKVIIAQAGHPHPIVQRKDGSTEQMGTGGLPVGLFPDAVYEQFEITLSPGDRLFISSDGITECPSESGGMLDESGLRHLIEEMSQVRGNEMLETLMWKLSDYAGENDFPDDVSAILLEFSEDA